MTFLRTPLFDWHTQHGGRMVEFSGWEMPVQYSGIVDEHLAVRKSVGLFDISHMGRLRIHGPDAPSFLEQLLTCRVDNLAHGQVRYGLVCDSSGGILDDILVNRIDQHSFGLVVNAGNRQKIINWIHLQMSSLSAGAQQLDLTCEDDTYQTAMLAIQGPSALAITNKLLSADYSSLKYYTGRSITVDGHPAFISRTGYTGEDGFELILPNEIAGNIWESLIQTGHPERLKPCGLGCRDTLRLEAAMPLYGHELSETIDPLTAGLSFAVRFEKPEFIGREALLKIREQGVPSVRIGLQLASRRIARELSDVWIEDTRIGQVTSGTFSPTLERSIAMAYVSHQYSAVGTAVQIDVRGKRESAQICSLPFYRRGQSAHAI